MKPHPLTGIHAMTGRPLRRNSSHWCHRPLLADSVNSSAWMGFFLVDHRVFLGNARRGGELPSAKCPLASHPGSGRVHLPRRAQLLKRSCSDL